MSAARLPTIYYQIVIKKDELDGMRYGRLVDGSRAPKPIFSSWTTQSFLRRDLTIKPNKDYSQILIPTNIEESSDSFTVKGYLYSGKNELDEQAELALFTKNNINKKISDTLYEFCICTCELSLLPKLGIFKPVSSVNPQNKNVVNTLEEKTQMFFPNTPVQWKYNKEKNVAWIVHDSLEALQKVVSYFLEVGIDKKNIELGKTKDGSKPVLLVQNIDIKQLAEVQSRNGPTL
jgi:hypothetical protein